jgi:hypothetical protein
VLDGWRREAATSQPTSEEGASLALSGINQLRNKTGMIDVSFNGCFIELEYKERQHLKKRKQMIRNGVFYILDILIFLMYLNGRNLLSIYCVVFV